MKSNSHPTALLLPPASQDSPLRKPATILTGKVSQQQYDDVVNREFERHQTKIDDGEPGNGD